MAEFKTEQDLTPRARHLLHHIVNKLTIDIADKRININYTEHDVAILASHLLDVYKEGWDERSITL